MSHLTYSEQLDVVRRWESELLAKEPPDYLGAVFVSRISNVLLARLVLQQSGKSIPAR